MERSTDSDGGGLDIGGEVFDHVVNLGAKGRQILIAATHIAAELIVFFDLRLGLREYWK
jgi:hypothetical protein